MRAFAPSAALEKLRGVAPLIIATALVGVVIGCAGA